MANKSVLTCRRYVGRDKDYGRRWKAARLRYLMAHPLCRYCEQLGIIKGATVVDHITPHKGDSVLFWDEHENWQPLCADCHNSAKQKLEKTGGLNGSSADGIPVDPQHHWNRPDSQ